MWKGWNIPVDFNFVLNLNLEVSTVQTNQDRDFSIYWDQLLKPVEIVNCWGLLFETVEIETRSRQIKTSKLT